MWVKLVSADGLSKFLDTGTADFRHHIATPLVDRSAWCVRSQPEADCVCKTRTYEYRNTRMSDGMPVYEEVL